MVMNSLVRSGLAINNLSNAVDRVSEQVFQFRD